MCAHLDLCEPRIALGLWLPTRVILRRFTGAFLKCHDRRGLKWQVAFEVLGNFSDETLEREFADEKFS